MKGISLKILVFVILFIFVCGCATQSIVKTTDAPGSGEKIKIFPEPPQKAYEIISIINASMFIDDFRSPEAAEIAALKKLKNQAEKAGADGIIEVYIELLEDSELVSSTVWNTQTKTDFSKIESAIGGGCGLSPSINFKGKAIKFMN